MDRFICQFPQEPGVYRPEGEAHRVLRVPELR